MGCRINSDTVTVVDTWNPSPRQAGNELDATQDGLCVQSTSFTNGRITCRYVLVHVLFTDPMHNTLSPLHVGSVGLLQLLTWVRIII